MKHHNENKAYPEPLRREINIKHNKAVMNATHGANTTPGRTWGHFGRNLVSGKSLPGCTTKRLRSEKKNFLNHLLKIGLFHSLREDGENDKIVHCHLREL